MTSKLPHFKAALSEDTADKRIDILRSIQVCGSISQAARRVGVSYKAAWQAVDTLSNLAGVPLLEKVVGGAGGGGARLSKAGESLLLAAQRMEKAKSDAFSKMAFLESDQGPFLALKGLQIRTSMRNQLPSEVKGLRAQGGAVRVALSLSNGLILFALITKESAQLLGLKKGLKVLSLFKATAVRVKTSMHSKEGENVLSGQVTRAPRGEAGGEVAVSLAQELSVVGFVSPAVRLQVGEEVAVCVEESALVIALPD